LIWPTSCLLHAPPRFTALPPKRASLASEELDQSLADDIGVLAGGVGSRELNAMP
jgi:hypothetical protein